MRVTRWWIGRWARRASEGAFGSSADLLPSCGEIPDAAWNMFDGVERILSAADLADSVCQIFMRTDFRDSVSEMPDCVWRIVR